MPLWRLAVLHSHVALAVFRPRDLTKDTRGLRKISSQACAKWATVITHGEMNAPGHPAKSVEKWKLSSGDWGEISHDREMIIVRKQYREILDRS